MRNFIKQCFWIGRPLWCMGLFLGILHVFSGVIFAGPSDALAVLKEGVKVILVSYADEDHPIILRAGKSGQLVPKSLDPEDVSTHFIVHRDGEWMRLEAAATSDILQVLPKLQMVRLAKEGASEWGQWSAEFDDPVDSQSYVYLKNRASGGYLSAPKGKWTLGRMWTTIKEKIKNVVDANSTEPAPKDNHARLKIFVADELIKKMANKEEGLTKKIKTKVVNVVREIEPLHAISGGKDFTYSPVIHRMKTKYHDNWKFDTPGSGYVVFDARATTRMIISFSSVPRDLDGGMYYVSIGHENNTRTGIRKNATGAMLVEEDILKGAHKNLVITGGLPDDGKKFDSYWIKVDKGVVSYGKGRQVGKNELMSWTDTNPLDLVSFVGFGGGKLHRVHYKNIKIGEVRDGEPQEIESKEPSSAESSDVKLPSEFVDENIVVDDIAVGVRHGASELFAVIKGELYYRQHGAEKKDSWVKIETKKLGKIHQVSVGPRDGSVFVLNEKGEAFRYQRDRHEKDGHEGQEAASKKEEIQGAARGLITDTDEKQVQRGRARRKEKKSHRKKRKAKKSKKKKQRSVALQGGVLSEGIWISVGPDTAINLRHISVGNEQLIVGCNDAGDVYQRTDKGWKLLEGGKARWVAVGSDGSIFAIGKESGKLYRRDGDAWKQIEGPGELSRLFVLDEKHMWSILDTEKGSTVWQCEQGKWTRPLAADGKTPVANWKRIAVAPGVFLVSDLSGNLSMRGSSLNRVQRVVHTMFQKIHQKKQQKKNQSKKKQQKKKAHAKKAHAKKEHKRKSQKKNKSKHKKNKNKKLKRDQF